MSTREDAGPRSGWTTDRYVLTEPDDAQRAADALARGAIVAHGFANFYVITTRPDAGTVRRVNVLTGHAGGITTTPSRIPLAFDWSRPPAGLTRSAVLGLMDALFECGPFGFRGPAARHVPDHLTRLDGGVRTALVVAPGYRCPSNSFLARALDAVGGDLLHVTSASRAGRPGVDDEPTHHRADDLRAEFGDEPGFVLLEHANEDAARLRYSGYAPMFTSVLAFHELAEGRLVLERHGGLHVDDVRSIVGRLGFDLVLGPDAQRRLPQRDYDH
jgi:hypothetical protein